MASTEGVPRYKDTTRIQNINTCGGVRHGDDGDNEADLAHTRSGGGDMLGLCPVRIYIFTIYLLIYRIHIHNFKMIHTCVGYSEFRRVTRARLISPPNQGLSRTTQSSSPILPRSHLPWALVTRQ